MKMTFSSENKQKSDFEFPKLYLDHGERARIVCIEPEPEVEFVHTLKAPSIINGELVMEKVVNKDKTVSERPKMDFVGRHICLGIPATLVEKGKDPENCPTCAAAQQSDAIGEAQRRFAMHVVQYKTKPGSFEVQTPFQAELVVWSFTDRTFSRLTDIAVEHKDLRTKDLMLGPCENKMFQNFDIQIGGTAIWLESESNKQFVSELYASNKIEDLTVAIARRLKRDSIEEDIQKVRIRHAQAFGGGVSESAGSVTGSADVGASMNLDEMLGGGTSAPEASAPSQDAPVDVPATPDQSASVPAQDAAPAGQEEKGSVLNFDDIFKDMNI